jgi:hypothetical protein
MFDLWASEHSVLREKVLEHIFVAELSKVLLLEMKLPFEILRAEFDGSGYDLVVETENATRRIQLKAMRLGGKRAHVNINLALTSKPGGCVVWFNADEENLAMGPFHWLGPSPDRKLVLPESRAAFHSKGNAQGRKLKRERLRTVNKGKFWKIETMSELGEALFGTSPNPVWELRR